MENILIPYTYQWLIQTLINEEEKTRILNEVANDPAYMDACRKISKAEGQTTKLSQDLYQECFLILLEKPAAEIVRLFESRSLRFFFVRIVMNQWNSGGNEERIKGSSPFWNKYRKDYHNHIKGFEEEFNFDHSYFAEESELLHKRKLIDSNQYEKEDSETPLKEIQKLNNSVLDIIDELYWFDKEILLMYLEGEWTFTTLAKEIGIGRNKVNDSIQRSKLYIRERLNIKNNKRNVW
jgi:DNA-directed RNA polymerase specialized sigma24 family protein